MNQAVWEVRSFEAALIDAFEVEDVVSQLLLPHNWKSSKCVGRDVERPILW